MRTAIILSGWAWFALALPQVTNTEIDFGLGLILFFSGPAIGICWVGYSFAFPVVFRTRHWGLAWLSVPVVGLGSVLLMMTGWGLVARVWLCETELREFTATVQQGTIKIPSADPPRRVGLFWVHRAYVSEDEALVMTATGFLDEAGLVYRETPPDFQSWRYHHLYGRWYRYWDRF